MSSSAHSASLRPTDQADTPIVSDLTPIILGGLEPRPSINLRDFGFVGTVSEEARAQILANDRRAMMVLATAERFWFR